MHHPQTDNTEAAAASAVCAAKSAGWNALRRTNAEHRLLNDAHLVALAELREADVAAEEFRATYYPAAERAFGIGDRGIGQPFEMYVVDQDGPRRVWAEAAA